MSLYLSDFTSLRPDYELSQNEIAAWLAAAHAQSNTKFSTESVESFEAQIAFYLKKLAPKILKRGFEVPDILHREWEKMEIYPLERFPEGKSTESRVDFFHTKAKKAFQRFYLEADDLPDHLIHVTCTGYIAPSAAQSIVSEKNRGASCSVTHAYHMGCYAAFPAVRIGKGFIQSDQVNRVDIVHTELGSLHLNPARHTMDQLVIQSLFADGYIKYSLGTEPRPKSFELLKLQDEIISGSEALMDWREGNHGMRFTLSREIPTVIGGSIEAFIAKLLSGTSCRDSLFAIHPGGIKIIDQIAQLLGLEPWQYAHSLSILENYGNMSSATVPHIWQSIASDEQIASGTQVVSLAFGPGITIWGAVVKKL